MADRKRLLWLCRRGIREMDLLFRQYIDEHYENLNQEQLATLESLLNEADLDIIDWIMDRSVPENTAYLPILAEMKELKQKHPKTN